MHDDDLTAAVVSEQRWTTLRAAMVRAVRRQCPAWLSADVEDIAQMAVAKVMAADKGGEGNPPLPASYLYKVAHSALVDEIRRRRRRHEEALELDGPGGEPARVREPATLRDPESDARLQELGTAVRACLMAMKRERRLAVMLYLQEHTVPEAARLLGWAAKRTENLVYRGLADLRQCLLAKGHRP
jgi:RNA polymerase sigma-70 factor (ECF subfamily)